MREGAVEFDSVSVEMFDQQLNSLPNHWGDSAKAVYPGNTPMERLYSLRDVVRDVNFGWPAYKWATQQTKTGKSPVYVAYLAQNSEKTVYAKGNRRGAAHADDIMYLDGRFDKEADKYPQEKIEGAVEFDSVSVEMFDQQLNSLPNHWGDSAKAVYPGNPNGEGLPKWTVYDEQKPSVMQFKDGATLIPLPNKEKIQLIDRFMQYIRNLQSGQVAQ